MQFWARKRFAVCCFAFVLLPSFSAAKGATTNDFD